MALHVTGAIVVMCILAKSWSPYNVYIQDQSVRITHARTGENLILSVSAIAEARRSIFFQSATINLTDTSNFGRTIRFVPQLGFACPGFDLLQYSIANSRDGTSVA